jgi:hypothetical protein
MLNYRTIGIADIHEWLSNFYHHNVPMTIHRKLAGTQYISDMTLDPTYNDAHVQFFIATNESDTEIVAIVVYATRLVGLTRPDYFAGAQLYSLEVTETYRNQGLLKHVTTAFAQSIDETVFVANEESRDGRVHQVVNHLRDAFANTNVTFYDNQKAFLKANR